MFDKRHCEAIADTIKEAVTRNPAFGDYERARVAEAFADMLHLKMGRDNNGNRRFKRDAFLRACGLDA